MNLKSDLVLLFELASGWEIADYLRSRANDAWTWAAIANEMNSMIEGLLARDSAELIRHELFKIKPSNLSRWYEMFGIKSRVKRGLKIGHKYAGKRRAKNTT